MVKEERYMRDTGEEGLEMKWVWKSRLKWLKDFKYEDQQKQSSQERNPITSACNEFLNVMFEMIAIHFIENVTLVVWDAGLGFWREPWLQM